jgi:hypothetical protein
MVHEGILGRQALDVIPRLHGQILVIKFLSLP